jgi:diguanylate cyclase (GGDEF)-like protein
VPSTSILLIDPDRRHCRLLVQRLDLLGYNVHTPDKIADIASWLNRVQPDLVILDSQVKDLTLEHVLRAIDEQGLDAFTLVMGADPTPEQIMEWMLDGAFACLEKPVRLDCLVKAISKGLENKTAFQHVVQMAQQLKTANHELNNEKDALKRKNEEIQFLYDLGSALSTTLDTNRTIDLISNALEKIFGPHLLVFLTGFDLDRKPRLYANRHLDPEAAAILGREFLLSLNDGSTSPSFDLQYIQYMPEPGKNEPVLRDPLKGDIFPLVTAGQVRGLMGFYRSPEAASVDTRRFLLEKVAFEAAQSLYNAHQHEQALEMATRDPLTGLFNRRALDDHLSREFDRFVRYQVDVSIIIIDLDHFKSVNDIYGHEAGDHVLKHVAGIIRQSVRGSDVTARLGGEEFAVILPNTRQKEAFHLARRIEKALNNGGITIGGHVTLTQTVSQGVAGTDRLPVQSSSELLRLADRAMYQAKYQGRNTIRQAGRHSAPQLKEETSHVWQ